MIQEQINPADRYRQFTAAALAGIREGGTTLVLESQQPGHPANRYSWIATRPSVELLSTGHNVTCRVNGSFRAYTGDPWAILQRVRREYPGWYFGYFGYDLKNHVENLTSNNADLAGTPELYFFQPSELIRLDHQTGLLQRIIGNGPLPALSSIPETDLCFEMNHLRLRTGRGEYLDRIRQAQEMIREGEFYEVNLSHVLVGDYSGDPYSLFREMRRRGPVPFSAFLQTEKFSVCCASPERFLCKRGRRIFSQPIKGTSARGHDLKTDRELKERLVQSEKERAENLMIVDLVRHDLSRVSRPGSVRVPELFALQSFETVHQLISTVEGEALEGVDPVTILKSCFPMGSMTGAPKIRAMEAIEDLEDYKRGIYSGAIGYLTPEDNFDFNVVIRTAILGNGHLYYPVGGAITSDSDPLKEWEETLVKARALPGLELLDMG
ncbi:MAG: aminodeoxychorismate synthase component I [Balneolaceae bacterium]